jgi:hypothetical protein
VKENNSKLVKAIVRLDLPINTTSTYYDIIAELEKLPTIVSKEKKTSILNLVNMHQHHHHHHNFHHHRNFHLKQNYFQNYF